MKYISSKELDNKSMIELAREFVGLVSRQKQSEYSISGAISIANHVATHVNQYSQSPGDCKLAIAVLTFDLPNWIDSIDWLAVAIREAMKGQIQTLYK